MHRLAAILCFLFAPSVFAGSLFINGVRADGVRNMELDRVNVQIDAVGNILVTAPDYDVQVVGDAQQYIPPSSARFAATPQNVTPVQQVAPPMIAQGGPWWLITQDKGSEGQSVEVRINDRLIHTVRSGQGQLILDISSYVRSGANTVIFRAIATTSASGAPLYIYLGKGKTDGGTLRMDSPQVSYIRDPRVPPPAVAQQYTLQVD